MEVLLFALILATQPTPDDHCFRAAVFKEAGAESVQGIKAVRQTIKNRARIDKKSICSVVKQPQQFSFYKRGMELKNVGHDRKFLHKFKKSSTMPPVVEKCVTHFHNKTVKPSWARKMRLVGTVGNHRFYCKN